MRKGLGGDGRLAGFAGGVGRCCSAAARRLEQEAPFGQRELLGGEPAGLVEVVQAGQLVHQQLAAGAAGVVLVASFAWFIFEDLQTMFSRFKARRATAATHELPITGMTCNGCASRLQRVLGKQEGVETAVVSFESGTATVSGIVSLDVLKGAVEGAGFEVAGAA